MEKGETLKPNTKRKKEATDFWLKVASDANLGMNSEEIAPRYNNPKTGKPYSVSHINWILRKMHIK